MCRSRKKMILRQHRRVSLEVFNDELSYSSRSMGMNMLHKFLSWLTVTEFFINGFFDSKSSYLRLAISIMTTDCKHPKDL